MRKGVKYDLQLTPMKSKQNAKIKAVSGLKWTKSAPLLYQSL